MAKMYFQEDDVSKIRKAVRRVLSDPLTTLGVRQDRGYAFQREEWDAIVTAVTPSSNAPPIKYTLRRGRWSAPGSSSQGTWVDDSGGEDFYGWMEDPSMVPLLPGNYVRIVYREVDTSDPPATYYTILGSYGTFEVYLDQVGGSNGDASVPSVADYTYDVYLDELMTIKIASGVPVWAPRMFAVSTTPANRGLARILMTGGTPSVLLIQAFETFLQCSEPEE